MKLTALVHVIKDSYKANGHHLARYLVKGTLANIAMQAGAVPLAILTSFTVARLAGAEEYGRYVYFVACITSAATFVLLGLDTLLVRETAASKIPGGSAKLKGLIIAAFSAVALACLLVCFLLPGLLAPETAKTTDTALLKPALIALTMLAVTLLLQAALQGMQKIIAAQLAEKLIKPLAFLLPVTIAYFFFKQPVTVCSLLWFNATAAAAGLMWAGIYFIKYAYPLFHKLRPVYQTGKWAKSAGYFFVLGIVQLINARADVLLLGAFKGGAATGVYNIAARMSDFVGMSLFIINPVIAPSITGLYFAGQKKQLQKLVSASTVTACLLSLAAAFLLIFFGNQILAFFGTGFSGGYTAMVIIVSAQIINVACGPVGNILGMTGFEKFAFISMLAGSITNVLLNILLIPLYGLNGAATATAAGLIVWNVTMLYFVHKKVNITPSVWGIFKS